MKTVRVKSGKLDLIDRLLVKYGDNEPIFIEEIVVVWSEYSKPRVFQLLKDMVDNDLLVRYDIGIYYIPTQTMFGQSVLDRRRVIEKKYIKSGNEVYGFYSGLTLQNMLGFTTQMPNVLEVVTMKESTRVRDIMYGRMRLRLRSARTEINKDNVYALQLLEAFNDTESVREMDEYTLYRIKKFITNSGLKLQTVYDCASKYPAKAIQNLISVGVQNVFA